MHKNKTVLNLPFQNVLVAPKNLKQQNYQTFLKSITAYVHIEGNGNVNRSQGLKIYVLINSNIRKRRFSSHESKFILQMLC